MESDNSSLESTTTIQKILGPLQKRFFKKERNNNTSAEDKEEESSDQVMLALESLQGIDEREAKMIRAILKMQDTQVREIMVPRVDILAAEANIAVPDLVDLMVEGRHSRIPLYGETIDNIVGIVHSRDMLRLIGNNHANGGNGHITDLTSVAREPLFVPETKRLEDLLREFQERKMTIAIVVDEYGGVAGLATIEDIVEEIVGEIEDELEKDEQEEVVSVNQNEAIVDARVSLDRINDLFGVNLEGDGFDTLGGIVYKQLGKIPNPGDKVEYGDLLLEVLSTIGRRIKKVRVSKIPKSASEEQP